MNYRQKLGKKAEDIACNFLKKKGFTIITRNYRYKKSEIDIILQKNNILVFVEVKARSNSFWGHPETFVHTLQKKSLFNAANEFIITQQWEGFIRFDIIAIKKSHNNQFTITHFEDAFY